MSLRKIFRKIKNINAQSKYISEGDAKYQLGNFKDAIDDYSEAIGLNPNNKQALKKRGNLKYYLENYQGTIEDCSKAISLNNVDEELFLLRSNARYKLKDYSGANDDFLKSFYLNPYNRELEFSEIYNCEVELSGYEGLSKIQENIKKVKFGDELKTIDYATKGIEANSSNKGAYCDRGEAKSKLGDHKGAIDDFTKAIEINPFFCDAYYQRGTSKSESGDIKGAIDDFTRAIEINPRYFNGYYDRGEAKSKLGDHKGAIEDFSKAIEIDPLRWYAYYERGTSKSELGDHKGALSDFLEVRSIDPSAIDIEKLIKNERYKLNDYKGVIDDSSRLINLNQLEADPYKRSADAKYKLGDHEGAINDYYKAIECVKNRILSIIDSIENQRFSVDTSRVLIYRRLNNIPRNNSEYLLKLLGIDAEIKILEKIERIKYKSEDFIGANEEKYLIDQLKEKKLLYEFKTFYKNDFKNSTQIYQYLSKSIKIFYSAINYLSKVITKVDDDLTINSEEFIDQRKFDNELIIERALSKVDSKNIVNKNSNEKVFIYRGKAKEELMDYEGAINDYSKLIEINPNNQEAYMCRGEAKIYLIEKEMHNYQNSEEYINYLFTSDPQKKEKISKKVDFNPEYFEDFQKAIDDFSKVIEINPKNDDALIARGQTKEKLKDYEGAIQDYSNALEINPKNDDALIARGQTKEKLEDYEGAIQDYSEAQKLEPDRRFIQVVLNRAKKESKDPKYVSEELKMLPIRSFMPETWKTNKQRGFSFDFDYEDCFKQYLKFIEFISDIKNEKDHKILSGLILKDYPESINLIKDSINNFIEVIDHSLDWIDSNPSENFELNIEEERDSVFELSEIDLNNIEDLLN